MSDEDSHGRYTVNVSYSWSDCCWSGDGETQVEVYAKSPEQARGLAKRSIDGVKGVAEAHRTRIVGVDEKLICPRCHRRYRNRVPVRGKTQRESLKEASGVCLGPRDDEAYIH